ncbi:MAG TPA: hypothetical protein VH025_10395 [Solirubrobacteraceae bacterium]|nr:hypothetical protein [Solirubrobacteraceae bacterium]
MISARAQRTLVKSPPELWAELGEQDSLARHLSQLGEIQITASQPEKRVEWTADGVKGVVELKSSGWGTKVTLSVERDLPAGSDPAAASAAETNPGVTAAEQPEAHEPPATEPSAAPDLASSAPVPAPAPVRIAIMPAPAPIQLQPERALSDEPLTAGAAWAAERKTPEVPLPPPRPRNAAEDEAPGAPPLAVEKPGFFARLFGRRKRGGPTTPSDAESTTGAAPADTPATIAEPETEPEPARTPAFEPPPSTMASSTRSALDALQARYAVSPAPAAVPATGEPPIEAAAAAAAIAENSPVASGDARAEAGARAATTAPDTHETERTDGLRKLAAELLAAETEDGDIASGAPAPPAADVVPMTSEDTAASEQLEAETTAFLTGVLDRLGAAHHRPFSRA